jgi:hypothetical protein
MLINVQRGRVGVVNCLLPETDEDWEALQRMKIGETYRFDFKMMRNGSFHRKLFAMMKLVLEHMDDKIKTERNVDTIESMLIDLKILVGHYDLHVTLEGNAVYIPKSIDYASMDDVTFGHFYNRCVDAVYGRYMLNLERRQLEALVLRMIGFSSR